MIATIAGILLVTASLWAQVTPPGQISGQLTNGTPNGTDLGGKTVTLAALTENGWQTAQSTATDGAGRFSFQNLPRDAGTMFLPIAAFNGAWYYPPQPVNLAETQDGTVEIVVFDSTTTDEALRYDRAAMLIAGIQPDAVMVMEMSGLTNAEPKTIIGAEAAAGGSGISARFPLPSGAIGFQPQRGIIDSQIVPTNDGVGLAWPVFPGRQELAYSYQLPFSGDRVAIDKTVAYPVTTFSLYVPEGGLEIRSDQLQPQGSTELGGRKYQLYTATNLNRGDHITAQIVGLATASMGPQPSYTAPLLVAAGAMLLIGGVAAAFVWRRNAGAPARQDAEITIGTADRERQELIAEIARLDERFDQKVLPEAAYRETRAALMLRVIELTPGTPAEPRSTARTA
jgi:hypothetical protein